MSEFVHRNAGLYEDGPHGECYRGTFIGPLTDDELALTQWFVCPQQLETTQHDEYGRYISHIDLNYERGKLATKLGPPELPTPQPVTRDGCTFSRNPDGTVELPGRTLQPKEADALEAFLRDTREAGK